MAVLPAVEPASFGDPINEAPEIRRTPRQAWMAMPRLVRAAVLMLPLLGAGAVYAPRIESAFGRIRWERPAIVTRLEKQLAARLRARAAIEIEDDFTSGLSGWDGGPAGLSDWEVDQAGLVRPGKLALLRASRPLSNYRFEFIGLIRKNGLSWVFRALDGNNYYAMKIVIARPGPLPRGALVRYAVVGGVPRGRVQFALPLSIRNDTIYRVQTTVYQDRFVTSVNGHVVDTFFDKRHASGGVGLFREPGEEARIVRVRVADRDDFLGRICAYFSRHSADPSLGFPWEGSQKRRVEDGRD